MEKTIIFLSSNTLDLLKKAEYVSNLSEKEIIEKAIFRYCRYLITTQAKKSFTITDTSQGSSRWRIQQGILALKEVNQKYKKKAPITSNSIFSITGSNRQNIRLFFEEENSMIENYNYSIEPELSNKKKGEIIKEAKENWKQRTF